MSIHVLSWLWRQPIKNDGEFRLLATLADLADDDGVCYPSVRHLQERLGGVSRGTVYRRLKRLEEAGTVAIQPRERENGGCASNVYRVVMDGQIGLGLEMDPHLVNEAGASLVLPRHHYPEGERGRTPRARDLAFEVLVEVTRSNVNAERGQLNRALASIRAAHGGSSDELPDEIRRRAEVWPQVFQDMTLTASALAKHWLRLDAAPTSLSRGLTGAQIRAMDDA